MLMLRHSSRILPLSAINVAVSPGRSRWNERQPDLSVDLAAYA
jgi:hypothetical protein